MTKSDFPALRMRVDRGKLVPASQFDQERLDSYRNGAVVMVRMTEERDRVLVKKWFAILGLVLKTCNTPWKTKEQAHEAIKLALGIVNVSKTVSGQFMQYPASLSDLEDPEMLEALEQMTELLSRMTGVDVSTLKKEVAHIGADEENTNPGESSSQASPEPADDDSPVVSSAEEGAGDCLPSAPSLDTEADADWLKTAARMLWSATNVGGDTDANLSVLNAQRLAVADECPPSCDQAVKDKAGSIYRQCKAVVMSEVSKAVALKYIAGVAGIEERELQA